MSVDIEDYKGYTVRLRKQDGHFIAVDEDKEVSWSTTLEGLHTNLDKITKKHLNQVAYFTHYGEKFIKGRITSAKKITGRYVGNTDYLLRVSYEDTTTYTGHRWEEERFESVYRDSETNRLLISEHAKNRAEVDRLLAVNQDIVKRMEKFTKEELFGKEEEKAKA